jgi:hypothetical protein
MASKDAKTEGTEAKPVSATGGPILNADLTPIQREVLKYLNDQVVAMRLNAAVNKLAKARPEDALGTLARLLQADAKPTKVVRLFGREGTDGHTHSQRRAARRCVSV